jgi:hypothetical protein
VAERMRITSSGNVGIGTDSPSNKLEIVGANALRIHDGTDQGSIFFRGDRDDVYIKESSYQLLFGAPSGMLFELDTNNNDGDVFNVMHRGSSRFYINGASGNVGIGTTSPSEKLSISGAKNTPIIHLGSTTNNTSWSIGDKIGAIEFGSADGSGAGSGVKASISYEVEAGTTGSTNSMVFRSAGTSAGTNNTERMRITSDGSVGIGTDDPDAELDVNGAVITRGNLGFINYATQSEAYYTKIGTQYSYNESFLIEHKLQKIMTYSDNNAFGLALNGAGLIRFMNGSGEKMRISDAGNVGIGTTNPTSALGSTKVLDISSTGNGEIILDHTDAGTGSDLGLYSWARNNDHLAHIKATCDGSTTAAFISFHAQPSGGSFSNAASNEKMRIKSNGNVGIGTTSPGQKLTVNGRFLSQGTSTPFYIKVSSAYKSWVHHIGQDDGYIFAPSTVDGGETWDWANQTKLGANGVVTAKNFQLSSDKRFKNNIKDIKDIKVEATFKSFEMESSPGEKRYGVVAQELEKTNPELVETDHEGFKSVKYIDLLIAKIAELEARLEKLEK